MLTADGTVRRIQGGFWVSGDPLMRHSQSGVAPVIAHDQTCSDVWCDIRTIRAMEDRGWVERTNQFPQEWADVRRITEAGRMVTQ